MAYNRRNLIIAIGTVSIAGCSDSNSPEQDGGPSDSGDREETVTTGSRFECRTRHHNPTEQAVDRYRTASNGLARTDRRLGKPDSGTEEIDAVVVHECDGDGILGRLTCANDDEDLVTNSLRSIEQLRKLKTFTEGVNEDFDELKRFVNDCDVEEPQLFHEQVNVGTDIADLYVLAIDGFIETGTYHANNELNSFRRIPEFEDAMADLERTTNQRMMPTDELRLRATVDTDE